MLAHGNCPQKQCISNIEVERNKLHTLSTCELLKSTFVLLRIHDVWCIEWNGSIGILDEGHRPIWREHGVEHGWFTMEMRYVAHNLMLKLVSPCNGAMAFSIAVTVNKEVTQDEIGELEREVANQSSRHCRCIVWCTPHSARWPNALRLP